MPRIQTKYFGPLDCQPNLVFEFPSGLPGFEAERSFVFLERPDTDPILFLQSVSRPELCFLLLPVLVADTHYRLSLAPEDLAALKLPVDSQPQIGREVLCAAVVCAADESRRGPTVNLLAPIVVNLQEQIGIQAILSESGYPHRHALFPAQELAPCL